jgi:hypothetical protein
MGRVSGRGRQVNQPQVFRCGLPGEEPPLRLPFCAAVELRVVSPSTGLVKGLHFTEQTLLFRHEMQEPINLHLLCRLRSVPAQFPGHIIPLRMGVDAEFERILRFGSFSFFSFIMIIRLAASSPSLTTHII